MKSILFITAFPPNHRSGGQTFSLNLIKDLSKSYSIDLIYFSYPNHQLECGDFVKSVEIFEPSIKNSLYKFWYFPLFTKRLNRKALKHIKSIASNYDVLYFDFSQVAIYSLFINHPCKIVRCHDVIVQKFSRKNSLFVPWVEWSERRILKSANHIFVPSEKDASFLERYYGIEAVWTNEYLNDFEIPNNAEFKNRFIFFGLWSREENTEGLIWFVEKVLPLIDKKNKIVVMGGGLSNEVNENYLRPKEIEYLGFVDDALSEIFISNALIVPLFNGAGIKVKVLDSFTTGTPVIGTELAFEGIPVIEGLNYQIKNEIEMAKVINNFRLMSLNEKINARQKFLKIYNKNHLPEMLEKIISEVKKC